MTIRFKLEASEESLERMNRELENAPTYTMTAVPFDSGLQVTSVAKVRGGRGIESDTAHIETQSLYKKLKTVETVQKNEAENRYDYQRILGEGGTGTVYQMVDNNVGRQVAVKVLKEVRSEVDRDAFIREGMLAAKLEHPNIIPIYDLDVDRKGNVFLTMKKVEGTNLLSFANRNRTDTAEFYEELVLIILKTCDALNYAHSLGKVHQDVKPENIMVGNFGEVFLIDWGASSQDPEEMQVSPVYMSPQQAQGMKPVANDDIYCLGASLFHCLTGRFPTMANTIDELWDKKSRGVIDLPSRKEGADIPAPLMAITLKAMAAEPEERYASIDALVADLKFYQSGYATSAENASLWKLLQLFVKRQKRQLALGFAVFSVFLLMGGYHYFKIRQAEESKIVWAEKKCEEGAGYILRSAASPDQRTREEVLIAAQRAYRQALFLVPGNLVAQQGYRQASLLHFELALEVKEWGQAEEKLWQARDYGLEDAEYEVREKTLEEARTRRDREIRKRITYIMTDAGKPDRELPHDKARHELMALKGPETVKILIQYLNPDSRPKTVAGTILNNQIHLAVETLGWLGDSGATISIEPYMEKTVHGRDNPVIVQEAAIISLCLLTGENRELFDAVQKRLRSEPENNLSDLFQRVKPYYQPLARRFTENWKTVPEEGAWKELEDKAFALQQAGKYRDALDAYDDIIEKIGDNAAIYSQRADCYIALKDYLSALNSADKAAQLSPENPKIHRKKATILVELKRYSEAEQSANLAQTLAPDDPLSYTTRAMVRRQLGDYDALLDDMNLAIKYGGEKSIYWRMLAEAHKTVNNLQSSLDAYNKAVQLNDKAVDTLLGRADILMQLGRTEEGNRDLDRILAIDPNCAEAYLERSIFKVLKGDLKGALEDTTRGLSVSPEAMDLLVHHGAILKSLGRGKDAESVVDRLARILNDQRKAEQVVEERFNYITTSRESSALIGKKLENPSELLARGIEFGKAGLLDEARADFDRVTESNSTIADKFRAYQGLVWISGMRGNREEQFKYLRDYAQLPDPFQRGSRLYAWELLYCRDKTFRDPAKALQVTTEALKVLEKNGIKKGQRAHILVVHARAQYETGRFAEAVKTQERLIKLPLQNLDAAKYWLERYRIALKEKSNSK